MPAPSKNPSIASSILLPSPLLTTFPYQTNSPVKKSPSPKSNSSLLFIPFSSLSIYTTHTHTQLTPPQNNNTSYSEKFMGSPTNTHTEEEEEEEEAYQYYKLPKLIFYLTIFMSSLHHFLFKAFHLFGLTDLLLLDDPSSSSSSSCKEAMSSNNYCIDEALPVVKYEQLVMAQGTRMISDGGCIVCLHEFHGDDEVRRLTNCRHVFHRCCLDGWIDLGRRTCPLCRSPLLSVAVKDEQPVSFLSETNHHLEY